MNINSMIEKLELAKELGVTEVKFCEPGRDGDRDLYKEFTLEGTKGTNPFLVIRENFEVC